MKFGQLECLENGDEKATTQHYIVDTSYLWSICGHNFPTMWSYSMIQIDVYLWNSNHSNIYYLM